MQMIRSLCIFSMLAAFALPAWAQTPTDCSTPAALNDGWTNASPADSGIDPDALCRLDRFIGYMPKPTNIHAVLVARHGKLVAERYYTGSDQRLTKPIGTVHFGPEVKHDLRAITQNVVSLLVGIAVGEGKLPSLDTPMMDRLPDYAALRTPENDAVTLRQLLTMSSGMGWNEKAPYEDPRNSLRQVEAAADPVRFALDQKAWSKPGAFFNYSSGSTLLLMAVLAKSTGEKVEDYAREKLFGPLGITDVTWGAMPGSNQPSASGLRLRPRDTLKLGQLLLSDGVWNGRQVLPKGWAAEATTPRINADNLFYYGYHWWLGRSFLRNRDLAWAGGIGYGGQRLWVVPGLDLVVLVNAGHYDEFQQFVIPEAIFSHLILPATKD
jgi:CubicO group peptidase (beta-lactamase class C family)